MAKEDLYSLIPILGKKLIEKEQLKKENSLSGRKTDANISTSVSVESLLPFDKILENIVKISKGKYITIAKTNAVSLDDMDKDDQDNILMAFADFNNGLSKPYQIFIPSFSLDIRDHFLKLQDRHDNEEREEIREWIEDDIEFQKKLIEENDIIDTQFYLIFKTEFRASGNEEKDYIRAKKELLKHVKFASDELEGVGLKINQLNHDDIARLYYYFLNPFSAGIQEPEFNNLIIRSEKVTVKKKNKSVFSDDEAAEEFKLGNNETAYLEDGGVTIKQKIAPYSINDRESGDYIKCGNTYMTVYEIYDYPKTLPRLWGKKLYQFRKNIDISIHIKPIKTSEIVKELDKASLRFGSSMIDEKSGEQMKAKTMLEKRMLAASEDVSMIMDELDSGEQSFFHFSMYVLIKAKTLEDLNDICLEIENILGSMRVLFRKCADNMRNGLFTIMPLACDLLGATRNMLTSSITNSFPFTNFSFTHKNKEKSFFLGTHKYNLTFIHFNPFELENANGTVMGESGAGKSVATKKIAKSMTSIMDISLRMIDPEGESKIKVLDEATGRETSFGESIGAEIIDYFVGSKHKINILEPEPDDEVESLIKPQINFVKIFLNYILKDLQKSDMAKIDYSLIHLYRKFGFSDNKETYWDLNRKDQGVFFMGKPVRLAPTLSDLYKVWRENELIDVIGDTEGLANQLMEWTRLGSIDLFDGVTNVDFKNKRLIFNLKNLDRYTKSPAIFVLFQKLWDLSRRNPLEQKAIITDEAHVLFRDDQMGEYAYDINKRIRKYGGAAIWVTQNPTDFMKTKYGPEIIKNCSWSILMKQNRQDIEMLQENYMMTKSEAMKMTRFNPRKGESYLVADGFRIPLNIRVSPKELSIFTTRTSDLIKMAEKKKEMEDEQV